MRKTLAYYATILITAVKGFIERPEEEKRQESDEQKRKEKQENIIYFFSKAIAYFYHPRGQIFMMIFWCKVSKGGSQCYKTF